MRTHEMEVKRLSEVRYWQKLQWLRYRSGFSLRSQFGLP